MLAYTNNTIRISSYRRLQWFTQFGLQKQPWWNKTGRGRKKLLIFQWQDNWLVWYKYKIYTRNVICLFVFSPFGIYSVIQFYFIVTLCQLVLHNGNATQMCSASLPCISTFTIQTSWIYRHRASIRPSTATFSSLTCYGPSLLNAHTSDQYPVMYGCSLSFTVVN